MYLMRRFTLLLSLFALVDFATPIIPVGQAFEWDDEEEVTEARRLDTRRQLTRVAPVPRPPDVREIRTHRFTIPVVSASKPLTEWLIPLKRSHVASTESASPTEDH